MHIRTHETMRKPSRTPPPEVFEALERDALLALNHWSRELGLNDEEIGAKIGKTAEEVAELRTRLQEQHPDLI